MAEDASAGVGGGSGGRLGAALGSVRVAETVLWAKHLGRIEEEGLWIALGYLFAGLNEQEYLPLEGAVV
jgi:hypothetical protein